MNIMNSRYKLLISNFFVFGFSRIIVMLVPLILLPIISRNMPDITFFGVASIFTTIMSLVTHIVILGTTDSAIRLSFDYEDVLRKRETYSTTRVIVVSMNLLFILFGWIFKESFSLLFFGSAYYSNIFLLSLFAALINSMTYVYSAPSRVKNNRKLFVFSSAISTISTYLIALLLINNGNFLYALPVGTVVGMSLSFIVFYIMEKKEFSFRYFKKHHAKKIIIIGAPLVMAYLSLWVYQSADKILLTRFADLAEVGIYSVGAKVATIATLVYIAFNTGWSYFSYKTMNDKDQVKLISNIYRFFFVIMLLVINVANITMLFIFKLIFVGDYVLGAFVAPLLLSTPFIQVLIQTVATQYLIDKKTLLYSVAQLLGLIINISLNIPMIILLGAYGASIATVFSYLVPLLILLLTSLKKEKLVIKRSENIVFFSMFLVFILSTILVYYNFHAYAIILNISIIISILFMQRKNIYYIFRALKSWKGEAHENK